MYEILHEVAPYAPLAVFIASFLDIVFCTGFLLYGGALLGAVIIMLTTEMIAVPTLIITATLGSLAGNQLNYWVGRRFYAVPWVRARIEGPRGAQLGRFLQARGLLVFMVFGRFFAFARPFHALIIGSFLIDWRRFLLYDTILTLVWVVFWIAMILLAEDTVRALLAENQTSDQIGSLVWFSSF